MKESSLMIDLNGFIGAAYCYRYRAAGTKIGFISANLNQHRSLTRVKRWRVLIENLCEVCE